MSLAHLIGGDPDSGSSSEDGGENLLGVGAYHDSDDDHETTRSSGKKNKRKRVRSFGDASGQAAAEVAPIAEALRGDASEERRLQLLPPEPPEDEHCQKLQVKIKGFLAQSSKFNYALQSRKDFHNPYILNHIAKRYDIDQTGSNYPTDVYDPGAFDASDYFDALTRQQVAEATLHLEEKKKRTEVEFVTAGPPLTSTMAPPGLAPPRQSGWGASAGGLVTQNPPPPAAVALGRKLSASAQAAAAAAMKISAELASKRGPEPAGVKDEVPVSQEDKKKKLEAWKKSKGLL